MCKGTIEHRITKQKVQCSGSQRVLITGPRRSRPYCPLRWSASLHRVITLLFCIFSYFFSLMTDLSELPGFYCLVSPRSAISKQLLLDTEL